MQYAINGLPLPFFSAGGTSLSITMAAVGVVSVVRYFVVKPEEGAKAQLLFRGLTMAMAGVLCITRYGWFLTAFPLLTVLYAGWMLVLAGNPGEYNASASALDPVMADRMRLLWLAPDYPAWRAYMTERGVHPMVLSYLDDHRGHFYVLEKGSEGTGLVTARGWEDLSVLLKMMEEKHFPVDLTFISQFLQSSKVARSFYTYYQQYSKLIHSGIVEQMDARMLMELVQQMPAGFRTVFNLYAIEGYSHKEIGEMLGISETTSRTQLSRARNWLQARIKKI